MNNEIVLEDGSVNWFYGEDVPAGFYWVVLDVKEKYNSNPSDYSIDPNWFVQAWQGAILTTGSTVKKSSLKGCPAIGSSFVSTDCERPNQYKLKLKCFYSFEEAEKFVASGKADAGWEADYDWAGMSWNLTPFKFVQEKKIQGIALDKIWFNEAYKINPKSWDFKVRTSHFNEPTENQRIAQRQVDLNSARITKLEKELKDLRELQKLLKGMR